MRKRTAWQLYTQKEIKENKGTVYLSLPRKIATYPVVNPPMVNQTSTTPVNQTSTTPVNQTSTTPDITTTPSPTNNNLFCPSNFRESGSCIGPFVNRNEISTKATQVTSVDDKIHGGLYMVWKYLYNTDVQGLEREPRNGTITLPVTKDGNPGLVVSGHVMLKPGSGDTRISNIHVKTTDGLIQISENTPTTNDRELHNTNADAIFVPTLSTAKLAKNTIQNGTNIIRVVEYGGIDNVNRVDDEIFMIGSFNQAKGFVAHTGVTLKVSPDSQYNDILYQNQILGVYPSHGGDSGSPIIQMIGDDTARILGIHVGKGYTFKLQGSEEFTTFPSPESVCRHGTPYFKAFSTWENVVDKLGID